MKKILRTISLALIFQIFFNIFMTMYFKAFADEANRNFRLKEICEKVKAMKITELQIKDLLDSGLTIEDAEYYFKINEIVRLLNENNIEIDLTQTSREISDNDYMNNISYYRKQVLEGNEAALKKSIMSLNNLFKGGEYVERLINTFSNCNSYEIIFPDGAKVIYNVKIISLDEISLDEEGREAFVNIEALDDFEEGYKEALMNEGVTYAYKNIGSREGQWAFQSGMSYSKAYLYTEFLIGDDKKSYITYARSGQSSYGIVNIANSTGAIVSRVRSEADNEPAEARNEVIFTVTAAFGATFLILSMSLNPGINWTQYIIFRIYNAELFGEGVYGAKYTWNAAVYK